jgi:hypothetical protein
VRVKLTFVGDDGKIERVSFDAVGGFEVELTPSQAVKVGELLCGSADKREVVVDLRALEFRIH